MSLIYIPTITKKYNSLFLKNISTNIIEIPFEWSLIYDLIELRITKDNYLNIIRLSDYLYITNVDHIIDSIVTKLKDVDVVFDFEDFYKLSNRVNKINKYNIKNAINLWNKNKMYCFRIYGHISFWNTSSITNMDKLFQFTDFSCDLNRWGNI